MWTFPQMTEIGETVRYAARQARTCTHDLRWEKVGVKRQAVVAVLDDHVAKIAHNPVECFQFL